MSDEQEVVEPFSYVEPEETDDDTPLRRFVDWVLDLEDLISCLMAYYECQQHQDPLIRFNQSLECSWALSPFHQGYWTKHYSTRRRRFQSRFGDLIQRKREDGNYELDALAIIQELERTHMLGVVDVLAIDLGSEWTETAVQRTLAFCRAPAYRLLRAKWVKSHIECIESLANEFQVMVAVGQTAMEEQYLSRQLETAEPNPQDYSAGEDGFRRDKRISELIEAGKTNAEIVTIISDESPSQSWEVIQDTYIAAAMTRYCAFIGIQKAPRKGGRPKRP